MMASQHFNFPDDASEGAVSIWTIRRLLGRQDYSGAHMATYLALLQRDHGFPPPFPFHRRRKGVDELITAPHERSTWPKAAVDQWIADFLPPANSNALDAAALRAAAGEMDQAAFGLKLVKGGRA
jgi:hypothetical protein